MQKSITFIGTWVLVKRHISAIKYIIIFVIPLIIRSKKRPVIFSKWSGIGDIICTFPTALELKKKHPQAVFIYNCYTDFSCLPKLGGVADQTTSFNEIGLIGYWYRFLLGGFYHFISDDDDEKVNDTRVYIRDFGIRHGVDPGEEHSRIVPSSAALNIINQLLNNRGIETRNLIVIHPGPSWPVREWPNASWERLVDQLHAEGHKNIVQIGTSSHVLTSGTGHVKSIPNAISLVDKLSLDETMALISKAHLFIGIDSGMLHIAAAVGTQSIGIWGATSPEFRFSVTERKFHVTSPIQCKGCHHKSPREHWVTGCPRDIQCMKEISVDDVLEKIENYSG